MRFFTLFSFLLTLLAPAAHAALNYFESVSGDLSNVGSAPTPLAFTEGVNFITGTMGGGTNAEPDIITFTIQPGQQLTSIFLGPMTPQERSFFAIAAGSTINMTDATTHLGNYLTYEIGELMDDLSTGGTYGGTGFTVPLGAGTYTTWFQEITTPVNYQLAYTVIPEPGTTAAVLSGAALLFALVLRRKNLRGTPAR